MAEAQRLDVKRYQGLLLNSFTAQVQFWTAATVTEPYAWWIWKLIPVNVEDA